MVRCYMDTRLRICILGNIDAYSDEAQKNIAKRLSADLGRNHEVRYDNAKARAGSADFWRGIGRFNPDVIHIFLRPTWSVLVYASLLKLFFGKAKVVLSVLQSPTVSPLMAQMILHPKPDLAIALSNELVPPLQKIARRVVVLPAGVDTSRFCPVDISAKYELRNKYGLRQDKSIILHVGHATKGRNLLPLASLVSGDTQIVFVSSQSFNLDRDALKRLRESGCLVFTDYLEHIEELYQLADLYVFPTLNASNAIALPLSVLEAMACNLPVVTTRFGALPELFQEDDSFSFFDGTGPELQSHVQRLLRNERRTSNRHKVLDLDWQNIVRQLEDAYAALLGGRL